MTAWKRRALLGGSCCILIGIGACLPPSRCDSHEDCARGNRCEQGFCLEDRGSPNTTATSGDPGNTSSHERAGSSHASSAAMTSSSAPNSLSRGDSSSGFSSSSISVSGTSLGSTSATTSSGSSLTESSNGTWCTSATDCDDHNTCTLDQCPANTCTHQSLDSGDCNDGDACTAADSCVEGKCTGTPRTCTALDACHDVGTCNPATGECSNPTKPLGSTCEDLDACTYDDQCQLDGTCKGTTVSCVAGDSCGLQPFCNGTATCGQRYPDTTHVCNDQDRCTYNDHCDGQGGCVGTAITCTDEPGTCGLRRTCNGTSTCTEVHPGTATTCDDNQICTHSDHCDGTGACVGTTITCASDTPPCGAVRSCNGTATCTVSYPGPDVSCNDGVACTFGDHCDGAGVCGGTAYTCTDTECKSRTCNGAGGCNDTILAGESCGNCGLCTSTGGCSGECTSARPRCCEPGHCVSPTQSCN